jgi:hypothetical protein
MPVTPIRFVLTILAALLMALQFPAPSAPFASAHSTNVSATESPERYTGKGAEEAELELVTCAPLDRDSDTNGLHTRDRHRAAPGSTHEALSRALLTSGVAGKRPPTSLAKAPADTHRAPRSSTALSAAALQVFRC